MDIIKKSQDILLQFNVILFAYIFGSYVQNKLRKDSDIDIAIYLEGKVDLDEYMKIKMLLSDNLKREVDLVILNHATPLLKFEVYRNNILLFAHDKTAESKFKVKTLFEYSDIKKYLDLVYQKNIERLKEGIKPSGYIEVARKRLSQISASLKIIEGYKNLSIEDYLNDSIVQDVVEYNLFICINMIIDIATHIVVDNNIGNPETLGDAFTILYEKGYLTKIDGENYKKMVGLRNILSHEYVNVDKTIIFNVMKNNLADISKFVIFIHDNFI